MLHTESQLSIITSGATINKLHAPHSSSQWPPKLLLRLTALPLLLFSLLLSVLLVALARGDLPLPIHQQ